MHCPLWMLLTYYFWFIWSRTRNYFLHRNGLNGSEAEYIELKNKMSGSVIECKDRQIRAIKFIGRQFLLLTDIINHLNSCYSVKVKRTLFVFMCRSFTYWIIFLQIMINIMATFGLSVLTFYTFYLYRFQQNDIQTEHLMVILNMFILYLLPTLTIFYIADKVMKEVSMLNPNMIVSN